MNDPGDNATGCAMAADDAGIVLLYGGLQGYGFSQAVGTWQYSAGTWTQIAASGPQVGLQDHGMVFDSGRGVWVLYGGSYGAFVFTTSDETWEFDGTAWTMRSPLATPGGLTGHGMCFDRARNVTVAYLGQQLFEYDGLTWVSRSPVHNPGFGETCTMCYHDGIQRTVMFDSSANTGGTWTWDGVDWTPWPTGTQPGPRTDAELVCDPIRSVCILTGGRTPLTFTPIHDTWVLDGAQWTQVASTDGGTFRFGLAFDVAERLVVRFGGFGISYGTAEVRTWTWGATSSVVGSGCAGSNGTVTLNAIDSPRLGQSYSQDLDHLVGPIAFGMLSLQETAPTSLASIGMPGCTAYLVPQLFVSLPQVLGLANFDTNIPAAPGLVGTAVFAQGLSFDPGFNPAWLVSSNATRGVIGF